MIKSMKEHTLCTIAIHIEINFGNKNMSIFIMTHFYNAPLPPPPEKNELHELILFNVQNKYVRYSIYEAKQNKNSNNNNNEKWSVIIDVIHYN